MKVLVMTGCRANGYESDKGRLAHAVERGVALCGKAPGRRSDWSTWESPEVTCPKCKDKLRKRELAKLKKEVEL